MVPANSSSVVFAHLASRFWLRSTCSLCETPFSRWCPATPFESVLLGCKSLLAGIRKKRDGASRTTERWYPGCSPSSRCPPWLWQSKARRGDTPMYVVYPYVLTAQRPSCPIFQEVPATLTLVQERREGSTIHARSGHRSHLRRPVLAMRAMRTTHGHRRPHACVRVNLVRLPLGCEAAPHKSPAKGRRCK